MDMVENLNWATSSQGKKISCFKSTHSPQNPIILIGGVHGDEPEGVQLASATLEWIRSLPAEVQLVPWVIVPCLNPDGFEKNERTNGNGVDLNRNYPSRDWSPQAPKARYYPGPSPGSEPEIQAITSLIYDVHPRLIIHCHSWQPCVVYAGEPARPFAEALAKKTGYEVRDDIGYPTPGSLSRYGWHDHKIPIICIEEQESTPLEQVWPHFADGIKEVFLIESNLNKQIIREPVSNIT